MLSAVPGGWRDGWDDPVDNAELREHSETAAEAVLREPLVAVTVPAEALPTGTDLEFEIWYATVEPDVDVTIPAEHFACCPGPQYEHVLAGELVLRVERPLLVIRVGRGGTPAPEEEIAPGVEVVLGTGDTAIYAGELPREYANRGAEPVQLAGGGLFQRGATSGPPPGYLITNSDAVDLESSLPADPMTFALQRATLPPAAVLPGPPPGALHVVTSGQTARGLRTAISRVAHTRGFMVETLEGDGFVAVRKSEKPPVRKVAQGSSEPGKRRGRLAYLLKRDASID